MNRRHFIKQLALAAGAAPFTIDRMSGLAHARPFLNIKQTDGKILIVIQLKGGNDGLNTIIPYSNDIYYARRPNLAIPKSEAAALTDDFGLHPNLSPLKALYDDGAMTVVNNVGYANQNRSHFRSTDIWLSGSDADEYLFDGWAGRALAQLFPDYPAAIPDHPMAVQLGSVQSLMLQGPDGGMGLTIEDPNVFHQLVSGSQKDDDPPPDTTAGHELAFLKQVAAQSIQYADVLKERADDGGNLAEYPDTKLAAQLAIIAQLISGGLQSPVYMAQLSGFDTHSNQEGRHPALLDELAGAVAAFYQDMEAHGLGKDVLILTVSEFGRRLAENGSGGTDHGAAAPVMLFGHPGVGGFYGDAPDLTDLDKKGDVKYKIDFRQVYASVLQDHLGMAPDAVTQALTQSFATLPIINRTQTGVEQGAVPESFYLGQNYPNPFNNSTRIDYALPRRSHVRLELFDSLGRRIRTLVNRMQNSGRHSLPVAAANLPSGVYFYQLAAGDFVQKKRMMLVR